MGKIILIAGANGSGKSLYAESLVAQTTGKRFYIATMQNQDGYNRQRIEKHRRQRAGLGFTTMEEPYVVGGAAVTADSVVLLEDASNLLANNIFEKGGSAGSVFLDIVDLSNRCKELFIVTISGLSAEGYDGETSDYIHSMDKLNQDLAEISGTVIEMRGGVPVYVKGDAHDLT